MTQKGRGDLLFYGAQRPYVYAGPLDPAAGDDWIKLDANVHWDLHGILLSPDFESPVTNGTVHPGKGTIWVLSDGGIDYSLTIGRNIPSAKNAIPWPALT